MFPLKFTSKIYHRDLTLQKAKDNQQDIKISINQLNNEYNPRNQIKTKEKGDTLKSANKLFSTREEIINAFKKGIFLYIDEFQVEKESDKESTLENEEFDTTNMSELEVMNLLNNMEKA